MLRVTSLLKTFGPKRVKQALWDREFSQGRWDYLDPDHAEAQALEKRAIAYTVERYANRGSILDLGCGSGRLSREINADSFSHYTAVDISNTAIQTAVEKCEEHLDHCERIEYIVDDILSFNPVRQYDVIVFQEVLYYFQKKEIENLFEMLALCLARGGNFITRLYDREKYAWVVDIIRETCAIVEEEISQDDAAITLVFKPA
jgi:2-polyprenyl-3-methyl-5-hydroxy-6-metoxy-1,4-benzoquinol methylase